MGWLQKGRQRMHPTVRAPNGNLRVSISISLGAIAGALSRYFISLGVGQWLGTAFPFPTFFINLSGAFMMGFFTHLAVQRSFISPDGQLMIAVGFLGSYTTFSTYTLDLEKLLATGQWQFTAFYWIGSTLLGLVCLELGTLLARKLP